VPSLCAFVPLKWFFPPLFFQKFRFVSPSFHFPLFDHCPFLLPSILIFSLCRTFLFHFPIKKEEDRKKKKKKENERKRKKKKGEWEEEDPLINLQTLLSLQTLLCQ